MSRSDELLARLCPDRVESRPLGEIAELTRGNGMPKTMLTGEGVGAIHYGQIYTRYRTWATSTHSFVAADDAAKLVKADPGDIIITSTSENVEDIGKAVAWLGEAQIVTGGHATVLKHNLDPKFLAYWFQSPSFFAQKKRLATGTKVLDVSARQLAKVLVPVPPLGVQQAIVHVLDQFTQLEAELEAELKARQLQYDFYREELLGFRATDDLPIVPMGEAGSFERGRRFTKNDVVDDGIPSIHYGEIYTGYGVAAVSTISQVRRDISNRLRYAQPGDVVIASVGETVEEVGKAVAWLGDGPVAIHDDTFRYRSELNPKFVSYFLQTAAFRAQKAKYVARAKVKRLSAASLAKIEIPVPSQDEQAHVVSALDSFDALINDPSVSLSAELNARRKQYEYYRDRLLTFKEAA